MGPLTSTLSTRSFFSSFHFCLCSDAQTQKLYFNDWVLSPLELPLPLIPLLESCIWCLSQELIEVKCPSVTQAWFNVFTLKLSSVYHPNLWLSFITLKVGCSDFNKVTVQECLWSDGQIAQWLRQHSAFTEVAVITQTAHKLHLGGMRVGGGAFGLQRKLR